MDDKKVVDVTTEFHKGNGQLEEDILEKLTFGWLESQRNDHYVATVTYDDGSVSTGRGETKDSAIRDAT